MIDTIQDLFASSIAPILLGAIIGAFASFFVSYYLERRKWSASAAILRKDELYQPLYDELANKRKRLEVFDVWAPTYSGVFRFDEWEKIKDTSQGLRIPKQLRIECDNFLAVCSKYNSIKRDFIKKLKVVFPERKFGIENYALAINLSEKMLVSNEEDNQIVIRRILDQRSSEKELKSYITTMLLDEMEGTILLLEEWKTFSVMHSDYVETLNNLHGDLGKRIEYITKRYQSVSSRL